MADQYVLYDFKHNDRKEYLSEFDWYRSRYINEPFDFAFNNKVVCAEILQQYIRVAENYFIKNKGIVLDFEKGPRDCQAIYACLMQEGKLIIKPFALGKGNGVHLLEAGNLQLRIDGVLCNQEQLLAQLESWQDYIVCEYINQHSYAASLYRKTVNTIRMITMRDIETHRVKVFFAVQRIGTAKTIPVDNGSKGGLVAKIDLATGRLSEARCLHDRELYYHHPDSGEQIEGCEIPNWGEIKKEILEVADRVPFMDFIAWDLVVTEDGICVIEANTSSGVNIIQLWGGQRNGGLGEFFRYYNVVQ